HLTERKEVKEAYCAHQKIRAIFPTDRTYSFDEGLRQMTEWATRVGSRQSENFHAIEISKELPDSWR
ncbi:MAG: UDP-glucose 4-epimerase, partial [Verrucomicrobiota bacterium]|nr:UDP-glucose 4-epimerase [Verrucomicrobiota bacterium]